MAFRVLMRTGGIFLVVMLFLLRACIVGNAIHHARQTTYHPDGSSSYTSSGYRYPTPAVPDHSAWIMFNTEDAQTGENIRHSRLSAITAPAPDGHTAPPDVLELSEQGRKEHHIRFTLHNPASCPGLASLHAVFGANPPADIAVKPVSGETGCTVEVVDYAAVLQSLQFNDTLTLRAGNGPEVHFAIAGLSWD